MSVPLTVLMAVRDGMPYLPAAVESILGQTYSDFRFLIVDDASTDSTREKVLSFRDPRIELLPLSQNVGQTAALNIGLRRTRSPWIARMDADDFSAPNRLAEQMKALRADPCLRCVGTGIWEFSEDPRVVRSVKLRPAGYGQIRRAALFGSGLFHGSIVISTEALLAIGGYDETYRYASDREMFFRFLRRHPAANLDRPLVGIRRHPGQDSFSLKAANEYIDVFLKQLADPGYAPEEIRILRSSLAYSYLFRARCRTQGVPLQDWGRDQLLAFRCSPATWGRHWAGLAAANLLPARAYESLRGEFWRSS